MRTDYIYINYLLWSQVIFETVGPFLALIVLNIMIYLNIKKNTTNNKKSSNNNDAKLATILSGIVVLFMVCHFLRLLLSIQELFIIDSIIKCYEMGKSGLSIWTMFAVQASSFLLAVNCSVNIMIYVWLSKDFRENFYKIIGKKYDQSQSSSSDNQAMKTCQTQSKDDSC